MTNIPHRVICANTKAQSSCDPDAPDRQSPINNNKDFVALNATLGTYDTLHFWQHIPPNKIDFQALATQVAQYGEDRFSSEVLTIEDGITVGISYDQKAERCRISVPSLPKLYGGKDCVLITPDQVQDALNAVYASIGGICDIDPDHAIVSRCDSSTAYQMHQSARTYIDMVHNCTMDKVRHANKNIYDGESVTMRTRYKSIGLYDKAAQMQISQNLLRCEAKLMNGKVVAHHLTDWPRLRLSDLASGHTIKKAVELRASMVKDYFKIDAMKIQQYQDELDFMNAMKIDGKRSAGFHTIVFAALRNDPGLIKRIQSQMRSAGFSRSQVWRTMQTLKQYQLGLIDARSLYDELFDHIQNELNEAARL